ncbi:carbohydrate ABC transporter permease [Paenibacillus sacheonensis]|uniref:ABC transporter permease subunit n=1 Tax=Paenibacillus sacheonensis TaxID=742054 RepID=A0A7X4YWQ8_9BACL|nr:carbohydrate ABC transporter permease [Paenibacillus sacheonensis]MBM7567267.1 putative aldouronate transport system permease protein [Paenibacillus sacheonensis]NBC72839.1 ABC transporter permease subunit [Paenibacillus sacheonensis]
MTRTNAIRESFGDKIFLTLVYVFLAAVLLVVIYPLLYILSSSFSSPQAVISGKVWLLPVDFSLAGYRAIFSNPQIMTGYGNSLFYTVFGVLINVSLTVMMAYPLSRSTFYGRGVLMGLLVVTMMFSGGLIPYYLTVKNLHLLDTRWAMLLPSAMAVWQVIIARTFFQSSIPKELGEAAELDGCSDLGFLWRVVLPLSKPILAVLVLMYAVSQWNAYFEALIFLKSQNLFPLQIILRNILILNSIDSSMMVDANKMAAMQGLRDLLKFSLIVVATVPVLAIYPFVQKYFVQGIMIGSLKG